MTSTLEKLLYRLYCAPAEACRRSGEDDCAKNAEDSILQFCARGVSSLRCATKERASPRTVSCFAVERAPVWPTRGGRRVGVMHGRRAHRGHHRADKRADNVAHAGLAHVGPGVAPVLHRRAQVRALGWWHLQRDCTPRTSACSSWTRRRPPPRRFRRQRVHVRLHGGLRGKDAARAVAQGAPVPAGHGLTVHATTPEPMHTLAHTVAPTYAPTPAETPFPTPAPTPVPATPVPTISMTSTTTTSTTKTEVPTTEAQISCPEFKSHGNKAHENPATMPLPHCHGNCDRDAQCHASRGTGAP